MFPAQGDGPRVVGLEVAEGGERNVRFVGGLAGSQCLPVAPSPQWRYARPSAFRDGVGRVCRGAPQNAQLDLPFPVVEVPCEVWRGGQVRSFQASGVGMEAEFSGVPVDEPEHDGTELGDATSGRADGRCVERISRMRGSVDERRSDVLEDVRKRVWWGRGTRHATSGRKASIGPGD